MTQYIIGVDLGGTRIRAARLDTNLHIEERVETLTKDEEGFEATIGRIKEQIRLVMPDETSMVTGIGISAPGPLNPETGVIVAPPNLRGWHNVPLGEILRKEFGLPVFVGNDANVAALAEAARGAARGYRHVVYITVSTGIGSGIIIDGRLLLGRVGLAAEAGHMMMMVDERVSSLEKEAAGPAMARQARARIEGGEATIINDMVDGDLDKIVGGTVGKAAEKGDKVALDIVERAGRIVGLGIVNMLHLFNPEIVVVGGGVTAVGDLLFEPMKAAVRQHCIDATYFDDLVITTPDLADNVSVIGAATLVATKGGAVNLQKVSAQMDD